MARLLLGDCRDSMRAMDAESIDAIAEARIRHAEGKVEPLLRVRS